MKNIKQLNFVIIILFTLGSISAQTSLPICTDTYNASTQLGSAQRIIGSLNEGDCVYQSRSECYNASQLLAQASKDISDAFNTQTPNGCISCDLSSLISLAGQIDIAQRRLHKMGYPLYTNGAATKNLLLGWDYPEFLCAAQQKQSSTPDLSGNWCSNNDSKIEIKYDDFTKSYSFRMYSEKYPNEYYSTARYTNDFEITAETWNAVGHIYDDKIIFSDQEWYKNCPDQNDHSKYDQQNQPGYYLVQISGSGWRKAYGGAHRIVGHHYKIFEVKAEETLAQKIENHKQSLLDSSNKYCLNGPPVCPCGSKPYIWEDGPYFEFIESANSLKELYNAPAYQCEDRSYNQREPCRDYTHTWIKSDNLSGNCF